MDEKDEKKIEKLSSQLVKLMQQIYEAQQLLTKLESESAELLRKLLRSNG